VCAVWGPLSRVGRDHVGVVLLAPEASARDRLAHPDRLVAEVEEVGERLVHVVGALEGSHDVDAREHGAVIEGRRGDDAVRFDVGVLLSFACLKEPCPAG